MKIDNYLIEMKIDRYVEAIIVEAASARQKFPPFNSLHEAYAVIKEELDELWEDVRRNNLEGVKKEAVQVAAMALQLTREADQLAVHGEIREIDEELDRDGAFKS